MVGRLPYIIAADDSVNYEINAVETEDVVNAESLSGNVAIAVAGLISGHTRDSRGDLGIGKAFSGKILILLRGAIEVIVAGDHDRDIAELRNDRLLDLEHLNDIVKLPDICLLGKLSGRVVFKALIAV